jgi:hypothetical protein
MNLFQNPLAKRNSLPPPPTPNGAGAATLEAERSRAEARAAEAEARRAKALEREREIAARKAYAQGRRDEHIRHRGHPFIALLLLLAAGAAGFVAYLAVREGSFTGAGQVLDRNIATATTTAGQATQQASGRAGAALQNAGAHLKRAAS